MPNPFLAASEYISRYFKRKYTKTYMPIKIERIRDIYESACLDSNNIKPLGHLRLFFKNSQGFVITAGKIERHPEFIKEVRKFGYRAYDPGIFSARMIKKGKEYLYVDINFYCSTTELESILNDPARGLSGPIEVINEIRRRGKPPFQADRELVSRCFDID